MDHGLYTAYLGMRARQRALEVMANNIANASTAGFKADRLLYRSIEAAAMEDRLAGDPQAPVPNGAGGQPNVRLVSLGGLSLDSSFTTSHGTNVGVVNSTIADFSRGQIRQTGRSMDLALDGDGFLVVQTARGERYTRAGELKVNAEGQIVTQNGDLVKGIVRGVEGPITLPPGEVSIGEYGDISVNAEVVGQLKLVRFDKPSIQLLKEGASMFVAPNAKPVSDTGTRVVQHALEMSNVDAVSEMAAMIQNSREFESLQKSVTMLMSDLGRKVASEIGKI